MNREKLLLGNLKGSFRFSRYTGKKFMVEMVVPAKKHVLSFPLCKYAGHDGNSQDLNTLIVNLGDSQVSIG